MGPIDEDGNPDPLDLIEFDLSFEFCAICGVRHDTTDIDECINNLRIRFEVGAQPWQDN